MTNRISFLDNVEDWILVDVDGMMKGATITVCQRTGDVIALSTRNCLDCDRWRNDDTTNNTVPSLECYSDQLQYLELDKCRYLVYLDDLSIGSLRFLKKLFITRCERLQQLPDSLCNYKHLQELVLSDSVKISCLPESIGELTSLTRLEFGGSPGSGNLVLTGLPESIGDLICLQVLILDKCKRLQRIPSTIGKLRNLRCLSAKECKSLTFLPCEVGNCISLVELYLNKCFYLMSLPDTICNLMNLEDLSLCKSAIQSLPQDMGTLRSVSHLDISDCKRLECLPTSIGKCSKLYRLDCSGCVSLKQIPDDVRILPNLKELILPPHFR